MPFPLQSSIPRRQAILLLIAILIPCLVLAALGWRMLGVERQFENKRLEEARDVKAVLIGKELLLLLERIKAQEWAAFVSDNEPPLSRDLSKHVVFVGAVVAGRLQLPWENTNELLRETDFVDAIREAEVDELETHQYARAIAHYQEVIKRLVPPQQGYTQLLLAGAFEKANRRRESLVEYERVLALPLDLVDEYGIPLALFAAPALIDGGSRRKEILECIRLAADREKQLPPEALYMTRDVARKMQSPEIEGLMTRAIEEHEWAEELQNDASLARPERWSERTWVPYGKGRFLLSVTPSVEALRSMVVAVRADEVLARLMTVHPFRVAGPADSDAELLGEGFPGLRVVIPPQEGTRFRQILLAFAIIMALAFALLAGYLLQRDVQRSLRLAELRSQFVSSVTHELKTPLTAIRMFTETLRLDEEVDRQTHREYLDTIIHESERLSRLVDNVLDFGNIERGKRIYRFKPVRLDEVVDGAARTIQYPIEQAGFALDVTVERDLPLIAADSDALEQAILNLLVNAMKYSGDSRRIRLALDRNSEYAQIHVTDQGIGISTAEQERIFERFYRVTTTGNQHIQGAGLGLTLATHIVKAHGGKLVVESRLGAGSTFTIRLPLRESESAERVGNSV